MIEDAASREAEAALLGAILTGADPRNVVLASLVIEDLTEPRHRLVLVAMQQLARRGAPTDPVTTLGEIRAAGRAPSFSADRTAGVFLVDLIDSCPVPANVRWYAAVVLEHSARRRIAKTAAVLQQAAPRMALDRLVDLAESELRSVRAAASRASAASGGGRQVLHVVPTERGSA